MTFVDVCQEIADVLSDALGVDWSCLPNIEPTFSPPATFVLDPVAWDNDQSFDGYMRIRLPIRYAVPAGSYKESRMQLFDALMVGKNALDASSSLAGLVEALSIPRVENFGNYRTADGAVYYAAEQIIEFLMPCR